MNSRLYFEYQDISKSVQLRDVDLHANLGNTPMSDVLSQYSRYVQEKEAYLERVLSEMGCAHISKEIVPALLTKGYRSRGKFKIFAGKDGCTIMGTDPRLGEVRMEQALWIFPEWGRELIRKLSAIFMQRYEKLPVDGFEVQLAHGHNQAHITLSVKKSLEGNYAPLAKDLLDQIDHLDGIAIPSQRKHYGSKLIAHRLGENELIAHHSAFFQSNLGLLEQFVQDIKRELDPIGYDRLLDLYCGVGLISLCAGEQDRQILGVDSSRIAVECAQKNAGQMGFLKADFFCSLVEDYVQADVIRSGDLVILDPPRSGCPDSVIDSVAKAKPRNICLVSCYLQTHAKDLKLWLEKGYSIRCFKAYDMFPYTDFLETVTWLERNI